ncbi:MAG: hypothetical protein Q4G42_08050 [Neisseria sp.]|nr:hypothetical protein [Neisseria sp.]
MPEYPTWKCLFDQNTADILKLFPMLGTFTLSPPDNIFYNHGASEKLWRVDLTAICLAGKEHIKGNSGSIALNMGRSMTKKEQLKPPS